MILKYALSALQHKKIRIIINVFNIMFGTIILVSLMNLVESFAARAVDDMNMGYEHIIEVSFGDFEKSVNYMFSPYYSEHDYELVASVDGVSIISGYKRKDIEEKIFMERAGDISYLGNSVYGGDEYGLEPYNASLAQGRMFQSENEIVVGGTAAQKYNIDIGDTISIPYNNLIWDFEVVGIIETLQTSIVNSKPETCNNALMISYDHPILQNDFFSAFFVIVEDLDEIPRIADDITLLLRADQDLMNSLQGSDLKPEAATRQILKAMIEQYALFVKLGVLVFSGIIIAIGILFFLDSLLVIIQEQMKEFGVLRVLGVSTQRIKTIVMLEATVQCVIAMVLGVTIGLFLQGIVCYLVGWQFLSNPLSYLIPLASCCVAIPVITLFIISSMLKKNLNDLLIF